MKALLASIAALSLVASPALAQTTNTTSGAAKSSKTMVTHGKKSTAVTTVTTKVIPHKTAKHGGKARHHARCSCKGYSPKAHKGHKTTKKTTTTTTKTPS